MDIFALSAQHALGYSSGFLASFVVEIEGGFRNVQTLGSDGGV